jgi:uncharacterized protein with GYD domain
MYMSVIMPARLWPGFDKRTPQPTKVRIGKSGRGQRRGKSNGISAPDQMEGLTKKHLQKQEQHHNKECCQRRREGVDDLHSSLTPWTAFQQQHSSSLQAGQSIAEGASRHSSGEQPQSAQRNTNFDFIDGAGGRAVLYNSHQPETAAMWFITLVKFRRPLTKADAQKTDQIVKEWTMKGIKVHSAFNTLGQYDAVWTAEAPDEKTAMQFVLAAGRDLTITQTLVAVPREEVVKWSM